MRKWLIAFTLLSAQQLFAQQVLVPYRKGELYGLSDTKGKMIIAPVYEEITWLQNSWLRTTKIAELKDTLEIRPGYFFRRNTTRRQSGLIHDGKIILSDEPFDDYELVAKKCIVAKADSRPEDLTKAQFKKYGDKRKFYSIFNLQGKNLFPENFKRIQKIDTAGISSKVKGQSRYILFMVLNFKDEKSLFVFDGDRQEISNWLIKDAYKLEMDPAASNQMQKKIVFRSTDKHYDQVAQQIDYASGSFVISKLPVTNINGGAYGNRGYGNQGYNGEETMAQQREITTKDLGDSYDAVPVPDAIPAPVREPVFQRYYIFAKDSLFYMTGSKAREAIQTPAGTKIILREPRGMTQYDAVMAKSAGRFYIINNGLMGTTAYDSLIYFGEYFIAFQQINGRQKAGVIRADATPFVPMHYDSLYAGIPYFDFENTDPGGRSVYRPKLREADSKYAYEKKNPYSRTFTDRLTVFLNGKAGVVTVKGDTIIPLEYQMIAQNNLGHSRPREDDFIILKKDDRYGLTKLEYNRETKKNEMSKLTISPRFHFIPGFFYANYYGVKGFKLVGLYDEGFEFKGFADESGKAFFED